MGCGIGCGNRRDANCRRQPIHREFKQGLWRGLVHGRHDGFGRHDELATPGPAGQVDYVAATQQPEQSDQNSTHGSSHGQRFIHEWRFMPGLRRRHGLGGDRNCGGRNDDRSDGRRAAAIRPGLDQALNCGDRAIHPADTGKNFPDHGNFAVAGLHGLPLGAHRGAFFRVRTDNDARRLDGCTQPQGGFVQALGWAGGGIDY